MKIKRKRIVASRNVIGTIFYAIDINDAIRAISKNGNVWIAKALAETGWGCIDLNSDLIGSRAIGDTLYICSTDGNEIMINGSLVNPEDALYECNLSDLDDFIELADDDDIIRFITPSDIITVDFDNWAEALIQDGYTFTQLAYDYADF